ncbi:MAG TPA: TetR family transcriptional regulator [Planctomycetaceae bacterium]|nr:TetR family transcriptional regulator [Planctomycetaceae bacterium]HRF01481.1 TetR/AcrR family transcriptional regulator [Pirellulaceae bacterium]
MSSTELRKQREWLEREQRILQVARDQLVRDGYHGLNMDRIAFQLQYSKGTIYRHFDCKEEIVIAMAVETMETRVALFRKAAEHRACSRHRLMAIGVATELFVRLFPMHFKFEQVLRLDSIWEKTSEKRRSLLKTCESRCVEIVAGLVRDGLSRGELELPSETTPEDLVFGLWAMTFGSFSIMTTSESLRELGIEHPLAVMNRHIELVLDGYRWQPLSSEEPQDPLRERIRQEVFGEEFRRLEAP